MGHGWVGGWVGGLRSLSKGWVGGWVSLPIDDVVFVEGFEGKGNFRRVESGAGFRELPFLQPEEELAAGHVVHHLLFFKGGWVVG